MKLPNKVYDVLKWLCIIVFPALAWGYDSLAPLWNLPFPDKIPQTINIIAFVVGCIIGVSSLNYYSEEPKEPVISDGE